MSAKHEGAVKLVETLRSQAPLPICPYDRRSPEYWTTPDDAACSFCGGLPDGPDKCRGADTRVMERAADAIADVHKALKAIVRAWGDQVTNAESQLLLADVCQALAELERPVEVKP